jgi:hypothetical protein
MCPQGALEGIGQWEWDIGDRVSGSEHAQKGETTDLIAGTLAALGASVCCVLPLVLVALGIGGSWIASLTAMEPYRPVFVGLTLVRTRETAVIMFTDDVELAALRAWYARLEPG